MPTDQGDRPPLSEVIVVRPAPDAEIRVRGEVDIATSPDLDVTVAGIVDDGAESLVIDLSEVSFMGSSGLASLLRAHRHLAQAGGELVLRHPSRAVHDLLEMTRLLEQFHIEPGEP